MNKIITPPHGRRKNMRAPRKILAVLLAAVTVTSVFAMSACGTNTHEHTFDENAWDSNAETHWHPSTCGHDVKSGEAAHEMKSGTCTVCGYHEHQFSKEWSYNEEFHWRNAVCEHTGEKADYGEHRLNESGNECLDCGMYIVEHKRASLTTEPFECSYTVGDVRVQLLSDTLIRVEQAESGKFENRESWSVTNRLGWTGVEATQTTESGVTKIAAENYTVNIPEGGEAKDVYVTDGEGTEIWRFGGMTDTNVYLPSPSDALESWYFTDSPRIIPSEYGYTATENTAPLQGWDFSGKEATDIFVFLPQGNYERFCTDYINLTGRSEMVNLSTLGFWDSRYYAYSAETALQQIKDYRDRGYAIDVLVIDTDWRKAGSGMGYEINTNLFPNMAKFLEECEKLGVEICFNDHPEPKAGTSNSLDKAEVEYRGENLTLLLSLGVDYWWYDRNWLDTVDGFDPEISPYAFGMYAYNWITEDYFESIADIHEYARRSVIMGNVDGCLHGDWKYASDISAHRYSIQWTGDIENNEAALKQEIFATIFGGAEMGLPYISSDLGGHKGTPSKEQYIRWIQYGMLSTIDRVHCWAVDGGGRMPWLFGERAEGVFKTYQDMRYRLLPVFYNLVRENYDTGLPVMRRLDIKYPQYVEAAANDEYLLGDYILVAPITSPYEAERTVFLPEGTWIDVWTGKRYSGPDTVTVKHPLETSPIFVREGALIPLASNAESTKATDWSEMTLDVYPSKNYPASTRLYEDDTKTVAYKDGKYRTTAIDMNYDGASDKIKLNIGKAEGRFTSPLAFDERTWNIRVHVKDGEKVSGVTVNGTAISAEDLKSFKVTPAAKVFAFGGSSKDGEVYQFTFKGSIYEKYDIEFRVENLKDSAVNENYDATETPFELKAYVAKPEDVVVRPSGATIAKPYSFAIDAVGGKINVLTFTGYKCTAKVTVRDRAGNVQTVYFGNINSRFRKEIAIEIPENVTGKLYVTVSLVATEPNDQECESSLVLS